MSVWEAEDAARDAKGHMQKEEAGTTYATIAVAHATLALAEQQRIANVIALASMPKDTATRAEFVEEALSLLASEAERTALGLD